MKYLILITTLFTGLTMSAQLTPEDVERDANSEVLVQLIEEYNQLADDLYDARRSKVRSRATMTALNTIDRLDRQINTLDAVTVAASAVAVAAAPPAVIAVLVTSSVRYFKVRKHRRLSNQLIRESMD